MRIMEWLASFALILLSTTFSFGAACVSDADCTGGTCQVPPTGGAKQCFPDCPVLTVANGTVNGTAITYGTVVSVTCDTSFILLGAAIRTCQSTGAWSGTFSVCVYAAVSQRCPAPATGQYNGSGTFFAVGTVLQLNCSANLVPVGDQTIECLSNGSWSGTSDCKPVDCGFLKAYFSIPSTTLTTEGTVVSITCYDGYELEGSSLFVCSRNGTWIGNSTCKQIHCDRLVLANGGYNDTCTSYGTVVAAYCDSGYILQLVGDVIRECLANGTWSGEAVCEPVDCGNLTLANGTFDYISTTFGSVAIGSCDPGFFLYGDIDRPCLANGTWLGHTTCGPIVCCELTLENGVYNDTSTSPGTVLSATCDPGFDLVGDEEFECLANGTWSGSAICVPKVCPDLLVWYAHRNSCDVSVGTTVSVTCDLGYVLTGNPIYVCDLNGTWVGNAVCKKTECNPLASPNVLYNTSCTVFGTVVKGFCPVGYTLTADDIVECLPNSSWSGEITCELVDCGNLTLGNGTFNTSSTIFNTVAGASCLSGFILEGDEIRVCLENGNWSGNTFCRFDDSCHCPPGFVNYDDVNCYGAIFNTSLTFSEAKVYCQNVWGGKMALPLTPSLNEFFKYLIYLAPSYFSYKVYWIGLIDDDADGVFRWYDTLALPSYTDWTYYTYGDQDCATYESFLGWVRDDCSYKYSVICEVLC